MPEVIYPSPGIKIFRSVGSRFGLCPAEVELQAPSSSLFLMEGGDR